MRSNTSSNKIKNIFFFFLFCAILIFFHRPSFAGEELPLAENPLAPIKTETPRETMQSFMRAMNEYKEGVEKNNPLLKNKINAAVRCLDLSQLSPLSRTEKGTEAAIMLKEIIDRVIVIDYNMIPEKGEENGEPLLRWRLRHTEIFMQKISTGERSGEFLFSAETVERAPDFFQKVKHLPYLKDSGHGAGYQAPWLDRYVPAWAREKFFILQTWQWFAILVLLLTGLAIKMIVKHSLVLFRLFLSKTKLEFFNELLHAALGPTGYIVAALFWFLSLKILKLEGETLAFFNVTIKIFLSTNIIWLAYRITGILTQALTHRAGKTDSTLDEHLVPLLSRTLKIFVVIFGLLFTAQNLGFNVMSLVAGLGIGGLAFALAAKDTVANFFGSLMVLFDSPFQVGDWIVVKGSEGTVEEIGFRSTRVRTFYNSQISIPNSELMNAFIDNMGRRQYRRVVAEIGVTYDTSPKKLENFMAGIKDIIRNNPHTRKDNFHVAFTEFGASSLVVLLYFFLQVPDKASELEQKQNIFLAVMRLAEETQVEFAFPTQTLHIESLPKNMLDRKE